MLRGPFARTSTPRGARQEGRCGAEGLPVVIKQAAGGEDGVVVGPGRKRPSTQVGGEWDADGVRAPKAAAPFQARLAVPPVSVRGGRGGGHRSAVPPRTSEWLLCWQTASTHPRKAGHCGASLVTSHRDQRMQVLIKNRKTFFSNETSLSCSFTHANHEAA